MTHARRTARRLAMLLLAGLLWVWAGTAAQAEEQAEALAAAVERDLAELARLVPILEIEGLSPALRQAIREVPREAFVPPEQRRRAYRNRPLPIGHGQTISQPTIVALMTELLRIEPGHRVYELGTGSGYQAAVLAALGAEVYSVEIVPELARRARAALDATGYGRAVHTRIGDGYQGWPEAAPFDAIVVTAAGDQVPPRLLAQLKPSGRMVLPMRDPGGAQQLVLVTRRPDGSAETRALIDVAFVPITGGK